MSEKKPFIFVAFAKEVNELSENLTAVLKKGEETGIYTVKIEHEATNEKLDQLLESSDIFDEIDIFHYINNQDPYSLGVGEEKLEDKQAFLEYLIQTANPKIVIFEDLMDDQAAQNINHESIPLLINIWNTEKESIQENSNFSLYFYTKLIEAEYLHEAFNYASEKITLQERFKTVEPKLHVRSGSEPLLNWRVGTAPEEPVISEKVELDLPTQPFPLFKPYALTDAPVFFGRQEEAKDLFYQIHNQATAPIFLLYADNGVGKTSLVQAGLTPFLLSSHHVLHMNMPRQKTILTALHRATEHPELQLSLKVESIDTDSGTISTPELMPKDLADFWELEEQAKQKPMVLILDQAENIFAKNQEQIAHFFEELSQNFNFHHPKGKLILVSQKSHCINFEEQLEKYNLKYEKVILHPLSKEGITNILASFQQDEDLQATFQLEIEPNLPELIGNKISELPSKERTFALQILLNKMWNSAKESNPAEPKFTIALFKECFQGGNSLSDFLTEQLEKLHRWNPEIAKSGLALDILKYYISPQGGSIERTEEQIEENYGHIDEPHASRTIWKLQELGLLGARKNNPLVAHLINKALAPSIKKAYRKSTKNAQICRKLLKNKQLSFSNANEQAIFLSKSELDLIRNTRPYMGRLSQEDEHLINQSRREFKKERKVRRRSNFWKSTLTFLLFLGLVGASLAWYLEYNSHGKNLSKLQNIKASFLSYISYQYSEEDPTHALRMAEMACEAKPVKSELPTVDARKALFQAYYSPSFYYLADVKQEMDILSSDFSDDGEQMFIAWEGGTNKIVGRDGELIYNLKTGKEIVSSTSFSPDGSLLVGGFEEGNVKIWNLIDDKASKVAKIKGQFKAHQQVVTSITFLKNNEEFITTSADSLIKLWNVKGKLLKIFEGTRQTVNGLVLSPDEKLIASISADTLVAIWDREGQLLNTYHADKVDFSMNNNKLNLLTLAQDSLTIWEWGSNQAVETFQNITSAQYSPDGKNLLLITNDKVATSQNLDTQEVDTLNHEGESILQLGYSVDGNRLFVLNQEGKLRVLSSNLADLGFVRLPNNGLQKVQFSADGASIFTQNQKNVRLWDCTSKAAWQLNTKNAESSFSPNGKYVLSYEKGNKKLTLWNSVTQTTKLFNASANIENAYFLNGNSHIYVQNTENDLEVWDFEKDSRKKFPRNDEKLSKVVFSDTANYVLRFYEENQVILSDINNKQLQELIVKDVIFVPNHEKLLTLATDGHVICLNMQGDTLQQFEGADFIAWHLSADGTNLALTRDKKIFKIFNIEDGSNTATFSAAKESELVFSPDNDKVLFRKRVKKDGNEFFEWIDFKNLKVEDKSRMTPISLPSSIKVLEFSDDSKYILIANAKMSKMIDISRGERKISFSAKSPFYSSKNDVFIGLSKETIKIKSFRQKPESDLVKFEKKGVKNSVLSSNGDWLMLEYADKVEIYPQSIEKISDWIKRREVYQLSESDKIRYKIDEIIME
jgi:WD40 repeat protein